MQWIVVYHSRTYRAHTTIRYFVVRAVYGGKLVSFCGAVSTKAHWLRRDGAKFFMEESDARYVCDALNKGEIAA